VNRKVPALGIVAAGVLRVAPLSALRTATFALMVVALLGTATWKVPALGIAAASALRYRDFGCAKDNNLCFDGVYTTGHSHLKKVLH
jgi:hypothetical protein